jgi:hypothetical protein
MRTSARGCGRPPSGGRWLEPTREIVHIDDRKNPEYRKGRWRSPQPEPQQRRPPPPSEELRRAKFAAQTARAAFGRFYWNEDLGKRMDRELRASRRLRQDEAARTKARKRNGVRA